ncbi:MULTISPECIES: DUF3397 domain-containing protein [Paenibacillus]|uniref:DUF3397 domain-containing protein n=1 Tax=Paenibacillus vini TaxID=1476024 RepID=A0ABQ4M6V6_9BACL|nr:MULTISPECIES: DUF3397 domain-containing protein [Paenibacillus]MDN4069789.1 DUF3397 domain-containing protein [Paenibacillus vini]GIP51726.1 hypothetical protein J42TS3_07610 [Paenibacillus vini]
MGILLTSIFVLSVMPIIPFIIVYFITYYLKKDKKAAVKLAMDVTTLFLILSVSALFNIVFASKFGFYLILLVLLIAVGLIGGAQNRMKGKVDMRRLLRAVWRLTFAGTGIAYILLFLISFITYVSAA